MKIKVEIGDESIEEFERLTDSIIRLMTNMRGIRDENGYTNVSLGHLIRGDLDATITLEVKHVKNSSIDEF